MRDPTQGAPPAPHTRANRLLFPLDGVRDDAPLLVQVLDKDFAGTQFLGQVRAAHGLLCVQRRCLGKQAPHVVGGRNKQLGASLGVQRAACLA